MPTGASVPGGRPLKGPWLALAGGAIASSCASTFAVSGRPAAVNRAPSAAAARGPARRSAAREAAHVAASTPVAERPRGAWGRALVRAAPLALAAAAAAVRRRARRHASAVIAPAEPGPKLRVAVFGATGYIGRAVVDEAASRGHSVLAVTRESSGIGGKQSLSDVEASFSGSEAVSVAGGDVTDKASLKAALSAGGVPDAAVCCLASRSGGREDSFAIDYRATMNCVEVARELGVKHFVLLSAVCVQRPLLAFQEAKLKAEKEIQEGGDAMAYSIVQPTAFFKSLLGQVKAVKGGSPFVMFGDGTEVRCKPISEEDLAAYILDCLWDPAKKNAVLPIGGPGPALSFKEQGELLFKLLDREPSFICVPYGVFDIVQAPLDFLAGLLPDSLADLAEYGRIGRYYAEQSMLVLDPKTGEYSEELTPSYGKTSLRDFLQEALSDGSTKLESQQLGDQGLGSRVGLE